MTGARNLIGGPDNLSFRLPGGGFVRNGVNVVRIKLDPSDTYTMQFDRVRGTKITTIAKHDFVYDDMLRPIFTSETGLETSL